MNRQRGIFEKAPGSGICWIRYADGVGRIRREKVGTFEEAKARLEIRKQEAKLGGLPRLAWRRRAILFVKIAEDALAYSDHHKRSARNGHSRMEKLLEWFGDLSADSITPQEIERRFQMQRWTAEPVPRACLAHLSFGDSVWQGQGKPCASCPTQD